MIQPGFVKLTSIICVPVMLVSCVTNDGTTHASVHNPRVVAARHTYSQGLVMGTVAGAAIGMGVGRIIANSRNAGAAPAVVLAATLIGAAVGAAAGGLYAAHVVNQRNQFANAELYLDGCIAQARHSAQRATSYNATLADEIARTRKGDPAVRGMIEDSRAVLDSLNKEIDLQRRAVAQAQSENASPQRIQALNDEIVVLEKRRDSLQFYINGLNRKIVPQKG